jgi:hypothetical protein
MADGTLNVSPPELKFKFELRKQIPTELRLSNPHAGHAQQLSPGCGEACPGQEMPNLEDPSLTDRDLERRYCN